MLNFKKITNFKFLVPLLVCIILSALLFSCSSPSKIVIKNINQHSLKEDVKDSVLFTIQKSHDLVIGYGTQNTAWSRGIFYYLFALKSNKWYAFKYANRDGVRVGDPRIIIDTLFVHKKTGDSLLNIVKQLKSWQIMEQTKKDREECRKKKESFDCECPGSSQVCGRSDGNNFYLELITPGHLNSVEFYEPGIYEECCPGWEARRRYLGTSGFVFNFFKRMGKL